MVDIIGNAMFKTHYSHVYKIDEIGENDLKITGAHDC